eukprot:13954163-Alexandrium_andersonii.AAC.1
MRPLKARIAAGLLARLPVAALRAAVVAAALPLSRLLGRRPPLGIPQPSSSWGWASPPHYF